MGIDKGRAGTRRQAGNAAAAACAASSTSAGVDKGTLASASAVAGFSTSSHLSAAGSRQAPLT